MQKYRTLEGVHKLSSNSWISNYCRWYILRSISSWTHQLGKAEFQDCAIFNKNKRGECFLMKCLAVWNKCWCNVCCTTDSPARHARSTLQSQCNHSSLVLYIGHTNTCKVFSLLLVWSLRKKTLDLNFNKYTTRHTDILRELLILNNAALTQGLFIQSYLVFCKAAGLTVMLEKSLLFLTSYFQQLLNEMLL